MNFFTRFNLRQRYNLVVFMAIFLASCLLIGSMYAAMSKYAYEYTTHYWANYTKTFSDSAITTVAIDSSAGGAIITNNLHTDKNIKMAVIYTAEHEVFASSGQSEHCTWHSKSYDKPLFISTPNYWCFSSPINYQGSFVGNVELVVSSDDYRAILKRLLVSSIMIVGMFSMLIYFLVSYFSGQFTSTIVEMIDVLKMVGQGGRGRRVAISGTADIEMMRDVFNGMLNKIELNEQILEQTVTDRTNELKIALDSSQSANIYKSQIMALVTHEMKTPLHATIGFMQTVEKGLPNSPDYGYLHDYQSRALKRAFELKDIIENILLQGRLEADSFVLSYSSVEIKTLVLECLDKATPLKTRNRNRLSVSGDDIVITTDKDALSHIISNLVSNAYKFTLDGDVVVKWRLVDNCLKLQVVDTGCGVAIGNHQKIFDAFWQEDMGLGRKYGGHGLGLAITKQLIQLFNGTITVEPNSGKGTVFTITVPCPKGRSAHLRAVKTG
jgi:signal transduction histidine kinase